MLKFLVKNQEIVGQWAGISIAGYEEVSAAPEVGSYDDIKQLFVDSDGIVKRKPPASSESAFWSVGDRAWLEPPDLSASLPVPQSQQTRQNWGALARAMEGSALLNKGYAAAGVFSEAGIQANLYITVILTIVSSTHNLDRLIEAFAKLRSAMALIGTVGDFTGAELTQLRQILQESGFELTPEMAAILS